MTLIRAGTPPRKNRNLILRRHGVLAGSLCALIFGVPLVTHAAHDRAVLLTSNTELANAGFFTLNWRGAPGARYELQAARTPRFRRATVIYHGRDTARVMSGLADGKYYYRVRASEAASAWSEPVAVTVEHHPQSRAMAFFGAGLIVFVATAALIVSGARRTRKL
jgi:hypothetical protein